jgi:hypothetical protein
MVRTIVDGTTIFFLSIFGVAALGIPLIAGLGVWERIRLWALRGTAEAHTGEVATGVGPARVAVRGELVTRDRLSAPLSGEPCVWYRVEVHRRYEEIRDTTNCAEETVWRYESPAPLAINDGTGPLPVAVNVLLGPALTLDGGDPRENTDATRNLPPGDGWYRDHSGLSGLVDSGLLPVDRLASPPKTLEFTVIEWVIREHQPVTVIARVRRGEGTGTLVRGFGPAFGVSNQDMPTLRKRFTEDAQSPWGILLIAAVMLGVPMLLCVGLRLLAGLSPTPSTPGG